VLQHDDIVLDASTMADAAAGGHIPCMEHLITRQCPRDASACTAAVYSQNMNTLRWLRERKFPWDAAACARAAGSNQLAVLQYLLEQGCDCDATACTAAARGGHLGLLRYLHSRGCPWEAGTACEKAATSGSLDVIKYILEHEPVPLTPAQLSEVLNAAGRYNQLPTAQWLRQQHGAQFPELLVYKDRYDARNSSTAGWHFETLDWARSEGCTASNDLKVSVLRTICLLMQSYRTQSLCSVKIIE
jgi:Ankyrin repeats (3 copies)